MLILTHPNPYPNRTPNPNPDPYPNRTHNPNPDPYPNPTLNPDPNPTNSNPTPDPKEYPGGNCPWVFVLVRNLRENVLTMQNKNREGE